MGIASRRRLSPEDGRFVGRETLLAGAVRYCSRAGPAVVAIRGDLGIGKTRFALELAERLERRGTTTFRIRLRVDALSEFEPFAELRGPDSGPVSSSEEWEPIVGQAARLLEDGPVVILLDDAHLATRGVVELFARLAEKAVDDRAPLRLVLVSADSGDEVDVVAGLPHALAPLEIAIPGLDEPELLLLLGAAGYADVDPQLLTRLHRTTGGNPLFVLQSVSQMVRQHTASVVDGLLVSAGRDDLELPPALLGLVADDLASLGPDEQSVLTIVGLWDGAVAEDLLCELAGVSSAVIDDLVDRGYVHDTAAGLETDRHLLAKAMIGRLGRRRRRREHMRIAAVLAVRAGVPSSVGERGLDPRILDPLAGAEIISHLMKAGTAVDAELLWNVGTATLPRLHHQASWGEVARVNDAVVEAGRKLKVAQVELAAIALSGAVAHSRNSDVDRSVTGYRSVESLAALAGAADLVATALCYRVRAEAFFDASSDVNDSLDQLECVLSEGVVSEAVQVEVLCAQSELLGGRDPERSLELAKRAVGLAAAKDPRAAAQARITSGISNLAHNRLREADADFAKAVRVSAGVDEFLHASAAARRPLAALQLGKMREVEDDLRASKAVVVRSGGWVERLLIETAEMSVALGLGDLSGASDAAERALRMAPRSRYYLGPLLIHPTLVASAALLGDCDSAIERLAEWRAARVPGASAASLLVDAVGRVPDQRELARHIRLQAERWHRPADLVAASLLGPLLEVAMWTDSVELGPGVSATIQGMSAAGATHVYSYPMSVKRMQAIERLCRGDTEAAADLFQSGLDDSERTGALLETALCRLGSVRARSVAGDDGAGRPENWERGLAELERLGAFGAVALAERARGGSHTIAIDSSKTDVTVLLTDVVGSTTIGDRYGDKRYFETIMEHDRVATEAVALFGGRAYDHTGDGLYAAFESSRRAFEAARQMQDQLARRRAGEEGPLLLRVALVRGVPFMRNGRIYGGLNNLAARVCSLGRPGSIVVDHSVRNELVDHHAGDSGFRSLGVRPLKGIRDPPELWEFTGL